MVRRWSTRCAELCVELNDTLMTAVQADPTLEIVVDVEKLRLEVPALGIDVGFPLDSGVQHRFLEGLDDIGLTMQKADDISAFETTRPSYMPASAS